MSWLGHSLLLCTLDWLWHIFLSWWHSSALDTIFCRWWLSSSLCTLYYSGDSFLDWNSLLTCAFYAALETLFSLIHSLLPFCPGNSLHLCPPSAALGTLYAYDIFFWLGYSPDNDELLESKSQLALLIDWLIDWLIAVAHNER